MEFLTEMFSHVCGQGRCFAADGAALPVCQRCLGLYLGAVLTAVWLAASGLWRRGLPSWSVFAVNVIVLLAALAGGLHLVPAGPKWRAICGLWTGHVVLLWLVGGAVHLRRLRRGESQLIWRRRDKAQALAAPALLSGLGAASPWLTRSGWYVWTAAAAAGAILMAVAVVAAALSLCLYLPAAKRSVRPGSR